MRKIILALLLTIFINANTDFSVLAQTPKERAKKEKALLKKRVKLEKKQLKEDIAEIEKNLDLLNEYSNKHDIEKIMTFYDKSYVSFDGFNYETFKEMLSETFKIYSDISYVSEITNIHINNDKAVVNLMDKTTATIVNPPENKEDSNTINEVNTGILAGECNYAIHLERKNDKWKIVSDNIINEITSIKYGSAKDLKMELIAPTKISLDEEYCLSLKMQPEKGYRIIASLGREEILYPNVEPKEVFRKLPKDGILERVVKSNKTGFNEYAIASVGVTKMDIADDFSAIEFKMTGLAFLMQRVNLYNKVNPIRETEEKTNGTKTNTDTKG